MSMSDGGDREIVRAIGQIEGTLAGFKTTLDHFANTWAEQDRQAITSRRQLHAQVGEMSNELARLTERIEPVAALRKQVAALEEKVGPMAIKIDRIEPIVAKLDHTYTQGSAIGMLIRAAWMAAAGVVGALMVKYGPG